ncbi:MAG: peptidylprolyl isomerase [Ignavibacteriaceae bacterium]|nr:peptidylprolyl isomerase [Ignavibacteriaceae bacterium]
MTDEINISDEEISDYNLEKNNDTTSIVEVKIIELLTEDLDVIKEVLDELNKGKDFRELAVTFTIRQQAKNNNGELGFFPVSEYGEIGQKAAIMKIGDMYGPIKVPEGYSLFELIDRKENYAFSADEDESEKQASLQELRHRKYSDAIINKTVELADKYGVKVSFENLESVEVLNTTTVIFRYFGFGGKLLAVPMTTQNNLWFKTWYEQKHLHHKLLSKYKT